VKGRHSRGVIGIRVGVDTVVLCPATNSFGLIIIGYRMRSRSGGEPVHEFRLTSREEEIAALLATGLTARTIAKRLNISTETVRSHTRNIYLKLRVKNKVELARKMFLRIKL